MSNLDHAFFYSSENGDRKYGPDSMEHWLKKFFTSGTFTGDLMVTANDDMTVTLGTGYINIDGKVRFFEDPQTFLLETAHATYDRIDSIIIERNDSDRDITAKVITGGYSSNPDPSSPVRKNGVDQRVVAQIYVAHGAVRITQADITDTRTDTELCGMVAGTVQEMDFSQFTAQFDTYFNAFKEDTLGDFTEFCERIKDQLSEDAAGNLQLQIDDLQKIISDEFDAAKDYVSYEYAIYDNKLWKFTADKAAGEWDESVVESVTVAGELRKQNHGLVYDDYTSGAVTIYNMHYRNGVLYVSVAIRDKDLSAGAGCHQYIVFSKIPNAGTLGREFYDRIIQYCEKYGADNKELTCQNFQTAKGKRFYVYVCVGIGTEISGTKYAATVMVQAIAYEAISSSDNGYACLAIPI
jgi:hypothetical protein